MLKLVLEIMLSQKLAALFAFLTVFAWQGVIGRPSPQVGGLETLDSAAASVVKAAVNGIKAAVGAVNGVGPVKAAAGAIKVAAGAVGGVRDVVGDVVS